MAPGGGEHPPTPLIPPPSESFMDKDTLLSLMGSLIWKTVRTTHTKECKNTYFR